MSRSPPCSTTRVGVRLLGSVHNVLVGDNWTPDEYVVLLDRRHSTSTPTAARASSGSGAAQQSYTTGIDAGAIRHRGGQQHGQRGRRGHLLKQPPSVSGTLFDTSNPALGFRFDLFFSGGSLSSM